MTNWQLIWSVVFLPLQTAPASMIRTPLETSLLEILLCCSFVLASVLLIFSIIAYIHRRRRSLLLLTLAFGTILGHSLIAVFMLDGFVSNVVHHLIEHALVIVQSILVLAAIYYARTVEKEVPDDEEERFHAK